MTSFTNKIDEWMQEAEKRPESAVRLIARRIRKLTEPDEELLAKNIACKWHARGGISEAHCR